MSAAARMQAVRLEIAGAVATLTLARPAARNALDTAMCEDLIAHARRVGADEAVKLVLVRAEGPAFCAGADLKERRGMRADAVRARRMLAFEAYGAIEALPMPAIAVVEGPAVGSGCEIAAACDFIVATPAASFHTPEALRGTVGATQRLPRVLGVRLAKDLMFTGRTLAAGEALAHGLVSRLVEPAALEATLGAIAQAILAAPREALALAKRTIDLGAARDPRGALAAEIDAIDAQLASGRWMGKD